MIEFLKSTSEELSNENLLNIVFDGKIKFLSHKFNKVDVTDFSTLLLFNEYISSELYSKYKNDKENLIISLKHIDFGPIPLTAPYAIKFWKYARLTNFYEELMSFYNNQIILGQSIAILNNKISFIDKLFPRGSDRRNLIKKFFPYNSRRRILLERILKTMGVF